MNRGLKGGSSRSYLASSIVAGFDPMNRGLKVSQWPVIQGGQKGLQDLTR